MEDSSNFVGLNHGNDEPTPINPYLKPQAYPSYAPTDVMDMPTSFLWHAKQDNTDQRVFDLPFDDIDIANGDAELRGYDIKQLIGMGGMSSVYLAVRQSDGMQVAIKTLKPKLLTDDIIIDRFIQEYQIAKRVNHKNIVRLYEQQFQDDFAYIAMSYLPGASLKSVLKNSIGPRQAVRYALDLASALMGLHEAGIIHRDIKPGNFHFNQHHRLVLIDFGVSKQLKEDTGLTQHGAPVGTPLFMSPEQILGGEVDERTDLYSLGVILYKMLTGRYPFKAINAIDIMHEHACTAPPYLPYKLLDLEKIVYKLLQKNPDDRYQSAELLYADLLNFQMASGKLISNV